MQQCEVCVYEGDQQPPRLVSIHIQRAEQVHILRVKNVDRHAISQNNHTLRLMKKI